ncbi:MAG: BON domain-containing protein [Steroidobacteraceae bacterium]|jgi:hypothetical protein|nr:BON domain-containing protein [Steroidobacteraceae bacterium]
MAYDYPSHPSRSRERERRERMRRGEDRDPYVSGSERRYFADRNGPAARAFEGARSYPHGGYPEETGYQHERRPDENDDRRATREAYEQGRGSGRYAAFYRRWGEQSRHPDYFGAGVYYGGGGFGAAPGAYMSGAGTWGAPGCAGMDVFSSRRERLPEGGRIPSGRPSYRGLGPKGYERSGERLREIICERLTDDPRIDASQVSVEVDAKTVKLTGEAPDRRSKYAIEELVERCGAQDVDNQLRVRARALHGAP